MFLIKSYHDVIFAVSRIAGELLMEKLCPVWVFPSAVHTYGKLCKQLDQDLSVCEVG